MVCQTVCVHLPEIIFCLTLFMPATVDCDYMFSWSADALIVISGSFNSPFFVNALSVPKDTISDTATITFVLVEESRIGTKIGNIHAKMNAVSGVTGSMNTIDKNPFLEFKPNRYITLNGTSGDLYVRSRIDRESLCSDVGTCCATTAGLGTEVAFIPNVQFGLTNSRDMTLGHVSCALRMLVLQNPANPQFLEIIVHILDVNDNAPVWSSKILDVEVPEHAAIGHSIKLPEAIDIDQGPFNTVVAYKLFDAEYSSETEQILCTNCLGYDDESNNIFGSPVNRRNSPFKLDSQMIHTLNVGPLKFDLKLRVEGEIDREKQSTYFFILYAIDGQDEYHLHRNWLKSSQYVDQVSTNSVKHTGTLTIKVNVLDINDHEPTFIDPQPTVTIVENTKPGTVIYQAVARDTDISDERKLTYQISASASPEVLRCFQIDPVSGEVKIKGSLNRYNATLLSSNDASFDSSSQSGDANFLRKPTIGYLIPLQVTDRVHKGTTILKVHLTQVNLHAPRIHIASHLKISPAGDQLWVLENTKPGSVIAMINMEDPDKPIQQTVPDYPSQHSTRPECFTSQDYFSIRPLLIRTMSEFKLILMHPLDRENRESYSIKIECWDSGSPPLSSEVNLAVHVEDVDDSSPIFERSIYLAAVKEDQPPNTLVVRVHATDADVGKNAAIFYHIVRQTYTFASARTEGQNQESPLSEERPMLTINPKTGEIYTEVILDRETISLINCTVEACGNSCGENVVLDGDAIGGMIRTQTQVIVTVEDVNDCKPQFNSTSYEFAVVEGQPPHTQIGRVFAVDHDAETQNNALRYSLRPIPGPVGQLTKLYITVSADGVIYTYHSKLDREHAPLISFEVVAMDNGNPVLSAFASVLVRVLDTNDNSPIWLFPKQFGYQSTINVSQHATIGLQLAQLKAVDPDEGLNGEVVYSILHGNEDGFLEVDSVNGALYLSKSLYRFPYNTTGQQNNAPRMNQTQKEMELHRKSSQMQQWAHRRTDNIYIHRIILKASDRGTPPLFNTSVLNIAIFPFDEKESMDKGDHHPSDKKSLMMQQFSSVNADGIISRFDHDLIIMIILITLTSIISIVLVTAICLIRCRSVSSLRTSLTPRIHNLCEQSRHHQQQRKFEQPIRRWIQPTRWFGRRSQPNSQMCSTEIQLRRSCPDLCETNKPGFLHDESITYTTGSPIADGSRLGDNAYFTICPGAWDGKGIMRDKRLAVLDKEIYRTLASSTVDNLGHTYLVEVSPKGLESNYPILKDKPSSSNECVRTDYQPLIPTLKSPKLMCTLEDPLISAAANASENADWTQNEHTSQARRPHISLPVNIRMPHAYCQTCDRSILKTFTPNNFSSNDVCSSNLNCA